MKTLIYDRNKIKDYKQFYEDLYKDLAGDTIPDWDKFEYLGYDADRLNEFMWYCHEDENEYIFKNFDLEKIENYIKDNSYENYQWWLIFDVFKDFVKDYPKNKLEFVNDKDKS